MALVLWLLEETQILKALSSNPSTVNWMELFTLICRKICNVCLKKTKNKRNRGRGWPIKKHKKKQNKAGFDHYLKRFNYWLL